MNNREKKKETGKTDGKAFIETVTDKELKEKKPTVQPKDVDSIEY